MKITRIDLFTFKLKYREVFKIALGETIEKEGVLLKLTNKRGITGFGEAAPAQYVTGETVKSVLTAVHNHLFPAVKEIEANDIELIHKRMEKAVSGNLSAKAAIDMACYDIASKASKMPLVKYLGGRGFSIPTDITIGIKLPRDMAESAKKFASLGFKAIKIKAGTTPDEDIQRIKLIRDAIGPEIKLRIDANQGWFNTATAAKIIKAIEKYNIELIEQPLPWHDIAGLKELKGKSSILIAADESAKSLADIQKLVAEKAVDIINIKLMKCGGIYPARQIINFCKGEKIPCMMGGMSESKVAVSAATHLACSSDVFQYADLDGDLLLDDKLVKKSSLGLSGGARTLKKIPGLGIENVNTDILSIYPQ